MSDHTPRRPWPRPVPDETAPLETPSPLDHIAYRVQSLFTAHDRTLTDADTAEAYTITLDSILGLLNGALATGVLSQEQHQELHSLIDAMRSAPDRL